MPAIDSSGPYEIFVI